MELFDLLSRTGDVNRFLALASVAAACNRYPQATISFNKWFLSRIQASNFGQNTDYMRVVSTPNI